ncbi:hypothetical protein BX600DRAFT_531607 [Xylariales sp. PMI_506]|nr:hypothetical protein BX600DRAFT_531607 [Xylariales sp. PMI_506]
MATTDTSEPTRPQAPLTLHHLKLAAHNLSATLTFYTDVLPFEHIPALDHLSSSGVLFGCIIKLAEGHHRHPERGSASATSPPLLVEIRLNEDQATAQHGSDPVTWGVPGREDLEAWGRWFDARGVKRSRVLKGMQGWVIAAEDPDGRIVRIYTTQESHPWTAEVDHGKEKKSLHSHPPLRLLHFPCSPSRAFLALHVPGLLISECLQMITGCPTFRSREVRPSKGHFFVSV